jgi:hypothetical protein
MRRFAIWAIFALILYWLVTYSAIRPTAAPTWTSDLPSRPAEVGFASGVVRRVVRVNMGHPAEIARPLAFEVGERVFGPAASPLL